MNKKLALVFYFFFLTLTKNTFRKEHILVNVTSQFIESLAESFFNEKISFSIRLRVPN